MAKDIQSLHSVEPPDKRRFGVRASQLSHMARLGARVPKGLALSSELTANPAVAIERISSLLDKDLAGVERFALRSSVPVPTWGGPAAMLGVARDDILPAMTQFMDTWSSPSAKILRSTTGAPDDAGLPLIVQAMVEGERETFQSITPEDGTRVRRSNGSIATMLQMADRVLRDAARIEVISDSDGPSVVEIAPANRKTIAETQIVVDLVGADILTREEAILRIDSRSLTEQLHPQIENLEDAEIICDGIGGSPGAAQGAIVFNAHDAQAAHAQGERVILVRSETMPEDIRGMHSAAGVLTSTGGPSSHAAMIAQGIGVPCVVGASTISVEAEAKRLILPDGSALTEGDVITLDGASGKVMRGVLKLSQKPLNDAFKTVMSWADDIREIGVRANADTLGEVETAKRFEVDGIGLTRTEHMFYHDDRINVVREMILASDRALRQRALERLLPMQRDDFVELFEAMDGAPVTIRLLDPPLHEFLPKGAEEIAALARAMDLTEDVVRTRSEAMQEFNPMLGKRGVRLAVTMPEVYEMQARAIFEAATIAGLRLKKEIIPEIMIPLVSAYREVEMVKERIAAIAAQVALETGVSPEFKLGVMVETPRAALRSGDLAKATSFLSFGTNDLTQMTYGLSRDDAGRFMREYVNERVFPEDPFLTLDVEGVGELMVIAARRARDSNPDLELGLCGEHGGDPASVRFCKVAGFDYVSCSPFRVPIARLAAAQATLLSVLGTS